MNKKYFSIDEDLLEILEDYIIEAKQQIELLEKLMLDGKNHVDYINIKRIAHNIKGSAGSYGIKIVSEIFQEYEDLIKYLEELNMTILPESMIDKLLVFLDVSKEIFERASNNNYEIDDLIEKYNLALEYKNKLINKKNNVTSFCEIDKQKEKTNIVLITTNKVLFGILQNKLDGKEYKIYRYNKISDFLKNIADVRPNCIITDYMDNNFVGTGLAALFKLSPIYYNIKFYILTSEEIKDIKGMEYCDGVFNKDLINFKKLLKLINDNND